MEPSSHRSMLPKLLRALPLPSRSEVSFLSRVAHDPAPPRVIEYTVNPHMSRPPRTAVPIRAPEQFGSGRCRVSVYVDDRAGRKCA